MTLLSPFTFNSWAENNREKKNNNNNQLLVQSRITKGVKRPKSALLSFDVVELNKILDLNKHDSPEVNTWMTATQIK